MELLIVIAILGALISILLPAVSRAREQAKVVTVNAELRQIGLCLDMYMQANPAVTYCLPNIYKGDIFCNIQRLLKKQISC